MAHRYFTLEEAERVLPKVKRHMTRLLSLHDELSALSGVKVGATTVDWRVHLLGININKRYHELSFKYFTELEALTRTGCYVTDVAQGLVDFYSRMGDKDVMLCWQYDEPNILHYHDVDAGYAGRQPITLLQDQLASEERALL